MERTVIPVNNRTQVLRLASDGKNLEQVSAIHIAVGDVLSDGKTVVSAGNVIIAYQLDRSAKPIDL